MPDGFFERKARCFGEAQYAAVQERWADTADLLEVIADLEEGLIHALSPAWKPGLRSRR